MVIFQQAKSTYSEKNVIIILKKAFVMSKNIVKFFIYTKSCEFSQYLEYIKKFTIFCNPRELSHPLHYYRGKNLEHSQLTLQQLPPTAYLAGAVSEGPQCTLHAI